MTPNKSIKIQGIPMSYVDTGSGDPIVFLHGNPTSSYLWRNVIPSVAGQGRCLAPDLIGMGASGKPPAGNDTFMHHSRYLDEWFAALGLDKVVLVLHDWGSALGFYWAFRNPEKVRAICYMEAIVRPRGWEDFPHGRDMIFKALRSPKGESMVRDDNFFVETVLPKSILRTLAPEEMEAYRRPFLTPEDRMPTLALARELPIEGEPVHIVDIVTRYGQWLAKSPLPKLLIVAEPGALLTGKDLAFCRTWPNQRETSVRGVHYLQEDSPVEIGQAISQFIAGLP
ncbi:haloalkane dehalogenase [Flavitalea sp. BT771]|uniref:haloalkane dehalogenase n=1 Tax=Flavitalea sp. BT771 TaxID=3063329 RepID=UPI0026E14474|nr:haloalkane dehalogenase [Flavitalea sp. BT771]MDO6435201.1 haloalkane dehalogenase [Flavitalea sp. BT771]MDV6224094.1 haloalkane dehalogenase [Flavitalea sp. BT771]